MFERACSLILDIEGPDSNDPADPGGWTRFGISQTAHPNLDLANLTVDGARAIYRQEYWAPNKCDELPWWAALCLFDSVVNMKPREAVECLQRTAGAGADGKLGPNTVRAVKALAKREPVQDSIATFMSWRVLHYTTRRGWPRYGRGWTRRCFIVAMEAARDH